MAIGAPRYTQLEDLLVEIGFPNASEDPEVSLRKGAQELIAEFPAKRHEINKAKSEPVWTDATRANRKALLGAAAVGLAMSVLGFVLAEIQALGLSFEPEEQNNIQIGAAMIISYFGAMFWYNGLNEYRTWATRLRLAEADLRNGAQKVRQCQDAEVPVSLSAIDTLTLAEWSHASRNSSQVSIVSKGCTYFLEYLFPLIFGAVAILVILVKFVTAAPA